MKAGFITTWLRESELGGLLRLLTAESVSEDPIPDAEFTPLRLELTVAGLDEDALRRMDPDDRVAALEQANLDPYDYIYLAC